MKNLTIKPYLAIARPDHWFKNVFMLPGIVFALYDSPHLLSINLVIPFILGTFATCLIASSNYTLNEILDAPMDALHPVKKFRPVPSGEINIKIGYIQWALLAAVGLFIGLFINNWFFFSLLALWIMGICYNVPPIRTKDKPYLDVLSESVNNPLRLFLGWYVINDLYPPTLSLIIAYWMVGAFFMTVKRYAEYKRINDKEVATQYRKSFAYYNEYRLLLSMVYYASAFSLCFGIFLIRYRIELILSVPFLAGFVPLYMRMAFWEDSPAQYPERLYRVKGFMVYITFCLFLILSLLFIEIPILDGIFSPVHLPGAN